MICQYCGTKNSIKTCKKCGKKYCDRCGKSVYEPIPHEGCEK